MSYTRSSLLKKPKQNELPRDISQIYNIAGFDVTKRENLISLDGTNCLYIAGNSIVTYNMLTKKRSYVFGLDGEGIGCFCMHPSNSLIAIGEQGLKPNIYICEYPSFDIKHVCKEGTERGYSSMDFSADGEKLSSVGQSPDFLLTVWDYKNERTLLHTKAFGQDVFKVAFSKDNDGRLTTSGTGHIRFWQMAATFTGLKLQGEIGKFGKLDLSDVDAFVELPDSKVVSGSETGYLLLWEGNFVKCRFVTSSKSPEIMFDGSVSPRSQGTVFGDTPAHVGGVFVIIHDRENNQIISAGADGKIKWWSFTAIDLAEVDSDISMDFPLKLKKELLVGEGVCVKTMTKKGDTGNWLIEDSNGGVFDVNEAADPPQISKKWDFHAGSIVGVDSSAVDHYAVTAGADGRVKLWDYINKKVIMTAENKVGCSTVTAVPKNVDEEGRTWAVGFEDGVVRCFYRGDGEELQLRQVTKPHNAAVTHIKFSPDGKYMATGSEDGLVFLLGTPTPEKDSYTPVGFMTSEDSNPINSISWRSDSAGLLYTSGDSVTEIDTSDPAKLVPTDSHKTYEMSVPTRTFRYKERPTISHNDNSTEQTDLNEEEEKKNADAAAEEKVVVPKTLSACYNGISNNFLIGFGVGKAGKLYECNVEEEYTKGEYHIGLKLDEDTDQFFVPKITDVSFSPSNNFLMTTCDDGSTTVRPASTLSYYVRYKIHSTAGCTSSCMSWDDEFFLSVGKDGLLAIYRVNPTSVEAAAKSSLAANIVEKEATTESIISFTDSGESSTPPEGLDEIFSSDAEGQQKAAAAALAKIEDITESNAYSIQDEKLKKEEDAMKLAAEKKKEQIREVIRTLQTEYEQLVKKNSMLPKEQQLSEEEMLVDPEFSDMLKADGADMMNEVVLECRHESEKSSVRLEKLMAKYIDVLDFESFYLKGLKNGCLVKSFPTLKLGKKLLALLEHVRIIMKGEEATMQRKTTMLQKGNKTRKGRASEKNHKSDDGSTNVSVGEKKLSTFEMRKAMRAKRNAELAEMDEKKPAEDADDVRDILAIEQAILHLGDYKIKSSDDYVVPEDQQVNTEKKRRQMVLLEKSIHTIKCKFNQRLTNCRNNKESLVKLIRENNEHVMKIDKQLEQTELSASLWQPEMEAGEFPESRTFFTVADKEGFTKSMEKAQGDLWKASVNPKSIAASQWNGEEELKKPKDPNELSKTAKKRKKRNLALASIIPVLRATFNPVTDGEMLEVAPGSDLSQLEIDEMSEIRKMLLHERSVIINKIEMLVVDLDKEIGDLRRDRIVYSAELKAAELRLLVLGEELHLLNDFEGKDDMLANKLEKCQREKGEVVANISDCHSRLQSKKTELGVWQHKDKLIMEEFLKFAPENHAFHEQLIRIFKRKIKRAKKKNEAEGGDESDEESDYDEDEDEDEDVEDEEVDDSCPPGCDTNLYENILKLREKRLDQEEVLGEFQKELDDLKKTHDRHIGRERQINKDLSSTSVEISKFQSEKQQHINELLVVIPLETSQVHLWQVELDKDGKEVPGVPENPTLLRGAVTMRECAVFNEKRLEELRNRIGELEDEIVADKEDFKGLHKEKSSLEKEKVTKEKDILKQSAKCDELQLLKFGQLVDIAALDKISVNNNDEVEHKSKSAAVETSNENAVYKINKKSKSLKENLLEITNENTSLLYKIAELNGRQFYLEKELNGNKNQSVADDGPTLRAETEERNRLVALVKLQAKEVDALKAEINLLRRKGGSIYAPGGDALPQPPQSGEGNLMSQTM